jgi:hypothetical protein
MNAISVLNLTGRRGRILLLVIWLLAQLFYSWKFGFIFQLEADKYIREAHFILANHHFSEARYLFYFTTIFIIAVSYLLHIGLYGAIFLIMIINLLSYFYFYKALEYKFPNTSIPFFVCVLLVTFWPYQIWSVFLYTESLFYSMVIMLFANLLLFRKMSWHFLCTTFIILSIVILTRPLGILFVIPVLLFVYLHLNKQQKIFFFFIVLLAVVLINKIVQVIFTTTSDWSMKRAFLDESIICDIPKPSGRPLDLSNNSSQFYQLFYYVTHNFSIVLNLALTRLRYFFFMVRDYYSLPHNVYLLVFLFSLYGMVIVRLKQVWRKMGKAIMLFVFSSILLFAMAVAFQCDDYHNRFFLTLMPFFVMKKNKNGDKT